MQRPILDCEGLGFIGFRVSGLGFRVSGLGFRVSGLGFRDKTLKPSPCSRATPEQEVHRSEGPLGV